MKLFFIKIGKIFKTIKEDGILQGSRRVFGFLLEFISTLLKNKKGDILIITGGIGDSARFRAKHYSEELNLHDFECAYTVQDDPRLMHYASKFKVFIFHRVFYSEKIQKMITRIKSENKEIIFETDDLVFDGPLFHKTETYQQMNALEKQQYSKGIGKEILENAYVKTCTTTTSFLAEKLRQLHKQVFIVPNKLSLNDLRIVKEIEKKRKKTQLSTLKSQITIGYFRGSAGHDSDFATITNPLIQILEKYPNTKLFIAGGLKLEDRLQKYKERIILSPYVERAKHFENVSKIDIALAPLVKNDPFCEAKSELKFPGAGILEIPIVAVRNQTFSEAIKDGIDGFLAETEAEWFEKIEKLILDENLRKEMGRQARKTAMEKYTTKNARNEEYYDYLKSKL